MRTNLTCDACRSELTALVDGAIHPAVARALLTHVEECAGCRARLEEHRAIADPADGNPNWTAKRG